MQNVLMTLLKAPERFRAVIERITGFVLKGNA